MNCKPGDLAVLVGLKPQLIEAVGRIVQLKNQPPITINCEPCWELTEPVNFNMRASGTSHGMRFEAGEAVYFDVIRDKHLRPIRDPGDDAEDESLTWLPKIEGLPA